MTDCFVPVTGLVWGPRTLLDPSPPGACVPVACEGLAIGEVDRAARVMWVHPAGVDAEVQ